MCFRNKVLLKRVLETNNYKRALKTRVIYQNVLIRDNVLLKHALKTRVMYPNVFLSQGTVKRARK